MVKINANLTRLATCRVPPPLIFNGSSCVEIFFKQFEAHCIAIYGENYDAWLQVLPSFTDGEPRNIVQSFGMGNTVTYTLVKERLLTECKRRTFGTNAITDFYGAIRRAGETLVCYSIRLQSLADMITDAPAAHKDLMVKTKFVNGLKPSTVTQISIRYGSVDVEFEEIVRLAQLLEDRPCVAPSSDQIPPATSVTPVSAIGTVASVVAGTSQTTPVSTARGTTPSTCIRRGNVGHVRRTGSTINSRCFECGRRGHSRRNCEQSLNR